MAPRTLAGILALALVLASCDGADEAESSRARAPVSSPVSERTLIVGLVGTMSGPGSWRGDHAFEGADVGIQVFNRSVEPDEERLELVTLDDGGDVGMATELVKRLAENERTVGVVYAGPPRGLPPAIQSLAEAGIPALMLYGDLYSARLLRPQLFQISPPLLWQSRAIANYLVGDRGYRRVGVLAERSLTGDTAVASLRSAVSDAGGLPVVAVRFTHQEMELRPLLERLRQSRVEAVVVEGGPTVLSEVVGVLDGMGALYRDTSRARIASARPQVRQSRIAAGRWRPQLVGFDLAITPGERMPPPGTVATGAYDRGAFYLPVPSFRVFRAAFEDWWGSEPHGHQLRAYEAVRAIGWALRQSAGQARPAVQNLAEVLEEMRGQRFGGLDVTLGPDDHTFVEAPTVGLWAIPRSGIRVPERDNLPPDMPWVPLARTFSIDGRRTSIPAQDWRHLFEDPPPPRAPAPRWRTMRFGIRTGPSDPIH